MRIAANLFLQPGSQLVISVSPHPALSFAAREKLRNDEWLKHDEWLKPSTQGEKNDAKIRNLQMCYLRQHC
jgi:hypothetical protein